MSKQSIIFNSKERVRSFAMVARKYVFNGVHLFLKVNCLATCCPTALPVPQQLSISPNLAAQQLSISWAGGVATTFDLTIIRTEFDVTVYFVRSFLSLFCLYSRIRTASQNPIINPSILKADCSLVIWTVTNHMKYDLYKLDLQPPLGGRFKWHLDRCVSV